LLNKGVDDMKKILGIGVLSILGICGLMFGSPTGTTVAGDDLPHLAPKVAQVELSNTSFQTYKVMGDDLPHL
jgi:hypothetical protein